VIECHHVSPTKLAAKFAWDQAHGPAVYPPLISKAPTTSSIHPIESTTGVAQSKAATRQRSHCEMRPAFRPPSSVFSALSSVVRPPALINQRVLRSPELVEGAKEDIPINESANQLIPRIIIRLVPFRLHPGFMIPPGI
jgi:hypothetical protein